MKKTAKPVLIFMFLCMLLPVFAGERTIPVDIFLMIDKSLSMDEPGKFDSMHKWVKEELIEQMLIPGDWITVYQFYEKPEEVLTMRIQDDNSMKRVVKAINTIKPDGRFTDIGYALDKIQEVLDARGKNGRFKLLLLITDLEQDAPWTSKYRGKQESFNSPYLAEARIIKKDNWFQITLDMDIQDAVVKRTQSLYSDVIANEGLPRSGDDQSKALIQGETKVINKNRSGDENSNNNNSDENSNLGANEDNASNQNIEDYNENAESDESAEGENNTNQTQNISGENDDAKSTVLSGNSNSVDAGNDSSGDDGDYEEYNSSNSDKNDDGQEYTQKNKSEKKLSNKTLFTILLIFIAIIVLILLIVLLVRIKRKQDEKKENKKNKIPLV